MPTSPRSNYKTKETRRASRRVLFVTTVVALVAVVALVLTSVAFFVKSAQDAQALEERLSADRVQSVEALCETIEVVVEDYTALLVEVTAATPRTPDEEAARAAGIAILNAGIPELFTDCGELR